MGNTEWTDEQRAWIKTRRKRHLRILAAVLSLCVLFATYPNILETFFVFAAEREKEEKDLYISGFSDLPEEIRQQTVPLGTGLEELALPDTLEAVAVQDGQGSAENPDEDADNRETGDVDEETDARTPSDGDEIGEDTGEPSDGEETGEETTGPSDGEETGEETAGPSDGEESGEETAEPSGGEETEADNSGSAEETENVDQVEQDTQPGEAAAEETTMTENADETDGEGDSAPSGESEDTELKQETHTVTLPEYQTERVITVERLENLSEKERDEDADNIEKSQADDTDTVIITGVTWQSAPAYDKDTEDVYFFTAVLPEGYALMEGVSLPQITVTVAESENVRLFLERANTLPDLDSLLEDAPGEGEEGYEAWEALFLESLAEAEELKELYEAFTETERAQIPADIYEKLAAWWEYADFMEEAVVYAASGTDWTLDDAGLLTIKSDAGMTDWLANGKLYNGNGGKVKEVVIEGGVTSVQKQAFGTSCQNLARAKILSGVKNIGEGAFMNCEGLERVEIPSSVENIEKEAFYRCIKLTDVVLPSGITGIGDGAFVACESLTNIEIPSSVTSLGYRVFANCRGLTSVTISENVTGIGMNMFLNCEKLTSMEIPAAVTSIGNTAFSGCTGLTKVKMFGETPPTLGTDVFKDCGFVTAGTEGILVPKGTADAYKSKWTDWAAYIAADAGWTLDDNGLLTIESDAGMEDWKTNGRTTDNIGKVKKVIIKDGVTSIADTAFKDCSNLASIEIPSGVTYMGKQAFMNCQSLTNIEIPSGVKAIWDETFSGCSGLTSVTLPNSMTSIAAKGFYGCSSLTNIEIPSSVTSIGANAFENCSGLSSVTIPDSVTKIQTQAFKGCSGLTSVTMSTNVKTIGTSTFMNCSKLTDIELPSGVTKIDNYVFCGCSSLKRIGLPSEVTSIGHSAFSGCRSLEGIEIPSKVTKIDGYAFENCSKLTSIEIPLGVTSIGDMAFSGCSALKKVEMCSETPLTTLGSGAFNNCSFVKAGEAGKGILVPVGKAEGYKGAAGWSNYAKYITDGSPFITAQPTDQTVQNGKSATFSVTADAMEGMGTMSYQWQVDKKTGTFANISGVTSSTYTISAADKTNDGYRYRCVVTNDRGTATSEAVTLTVTPSEAEKVAAAKKVVQDTLADITATNETTKTDIQNAIDTALSNAGITDVTVTVGDLSKTEATSSAPGSISGSVSIVSKNDSDVSDSVTISKTIEKLPLSEAEKVAAAKKIMQDVLAGITATNETTKEDIQNAIDTALSNAGITDVTVTVGDLSKTEATTGATGSLSGTVSVTSQNDSSVEDSVTINKTIAKLPATEAEKVAAAKKIVQDTLADITATNETTKADIQNAIDTALANANMADVTVTVGDLSKTEATSSAPGSISGSVSIVSKNDSDVSDSVTISKTIEKLPLSEAEKVAAAKKIMQDVLAGITATNETTKEDIQNAIDTALSNAGITDVTVTVGDLSKTEATTGATGSLSGTVSVTSQNDSSVEDSVTINKTIAKLPATEAEKVAAAKKIVQDALADITVTNETTKEDIQDVIDTALSNAGITDVTVTVGDLSKTEATSDAPGNISGDVSVVSKRDSTVRDDVTINKTIPATGESHTHNYEEWRHDAKEHWKVCSCGAAGAKSKHRYDNDRDTTCNDCGYKRKVKNPDKDNSDKDKPDHAGSETQNPTGNQQPTDAQPPVNPPQPPAAQQPVNPPTAAPVKTPQPVPGTAGDLAKQHGAQTPKQPERKPGQDTGQEDKATVQQGGMDSAKITAEQRSEGGTAQTDSGQQSEDSAVQTDNAQQAEGGTARTVQAAADGGRIAIPGEAVETGNLTENQKTATKFELEKGAVTVSVVCDDGKCTAGVNDTAAVANTVLTPEQIQLANDGENIEVRIDVKDISQTVAEEDKEVIESGLVRYREEMPELTLGRYVDISVFVKIGEGDWDAVTSTGEPIEVVMGIPSELVENGRTFYVIRAHGGEYTLLTDMDDDPETVTIRTDLFSAYALAYRQADGTGESGRCGLCHVCPTFLGICYFIWLIMIVAVVATGIILLRKKKN